MQVIQISKEERFTLTDDVLIYGVSMLLDSDLDGDLTPDASFKKMLDTYRDWFTDKLIGGSASTVFDIMVPIDLLMQNDEVNSNILSKIPLIALSMPQEGMERGSYGIYLSEPLLVKKGTVLQWKSTLSNNSFLDNFRMLIYYKNGEGADPKYKKLKILESDMSEKMYSELDSNKVLTINHKFNYTTVFVQDLMVIDTVLINPTVSPELIYGVDTKVSIARGLKGKYFLTDNEPINTRVIGNYLHVDISQTDLYYENGYSIPVNTGFGYREPLQVIFNEDRPNSIVDYRVSPIIIIEYKILGD